MGNTIKEIIPDLCDLLGSQELEIVDWLARGHTNEEIGGHMGLLPGTIKKYLNGIYDCLGITGLGKRGKLMLIAIYQERVDVPECVGEIAGQLAGQVGHCGGGKGEH